MGSDKERTSAQRLTGLLEDGRAAEADGFASFWLPQVPGYLDAMTAVALLGQVTDRIEIGTAVVPIKTRHPLIMAQQALTTQAACAGRFTLGIDPSHHWIVADQLGLPYERPAGLVGDYLDVLDAAFAGPGAVSVDNATYHVHSPVDVTDSAVPVLLAALGPAMLRIAGERAGGTVLWMADERAIGDYVVPRITAAATALGRNGIRVVAGVPVALCRAGEVEQARAHASEVSATRTSPPTTCGCSSTATPPTSATPWPPATKRPSLPGCAGTATPASPTSPPGWCRWARTPGPGASRAAAHSSCLPPCPRNSPPEHSCAAVGKSA